MGERRAVWRTAVVLLVGLWGIAVLVYSLSDSRPIISYNHELILAVAAAAIASGIGSLVIERTHPRHLALAGVLFGVTGLGLIVEILQSKYAPSIRSEPGDVLFVAAGALTALVGVSGLRRSTSGLTTQRVVAAVLMVGSSVLVAGPAVRSDRFSLYWACQRPGLATIDGELFHLTTDQGETKVDLINHPFDLSVSSSPESGVSFPPTDRISVGRTDDIICGLADSESFYLKIRVRSSDLTQAGPTRLLTISTGVDSDEIALHVGQEEDALSLRVRTSTDEYESRLFSGFFVDGDWHLIEVRFDRGHVTVSRDGIVHSEADLDRATLGGWKLGWPLTVGNESTGDRQYLGDIGEIELSNNTGLTND